MFLSDFWDALYRYAVYSFYSYSFGNCNPVQDSQGMFLADDTNTFISAGTLVLCPYREKRCLFLLGIVTTPGSRFWGECVRQGCDF